MLKKYTILFFLFNYLNTSVFFPEIVPVISDASCHLSTPKDEMNSLIEFVQEKCLGEADSTPEDEDDDIPDSSKFGEKEGMEDHIYELSALQMPVFLGSRHIKNLVRNDSNFYFIFLALHYSPPETGQSFL
ncbi:MAG: hypothetical protein EAZ08_05150 [Cytophagales bacterium]|nr:MAG: hypothetical protein EAZ08_05150 [Cytophagales bacterium]